MALLEVGCRHLTPIRQRDRPCRIDDSQPTYTVPSGVTDVVLTGTAAQTIYANNEGDTITSNDYGSTIVGGTGNDTLIAGHNTDTLTGGGGNDTFVFNFSPWSAGHITDFNTATDKLNLTGVLNEYGYTGTNPVADGWLIFQDDGSGNTQVEVNAHQPSFPYPYMITTLNGVAAASITSQDYVFNSSGAAVTTRYFHTDNLGSVSVLTDENANVVERDSYDTWGRRREPNGNDDPVLTGSITSQTTRGFTDQEELADVSLIHFNGRVYDPLIRSLHQRRSDGLATRQLARLEPLRLCWEQSARVYGS